MKIIIDLQGAQATHMKRGIGRYSLSFTKALIENAKHHEVLIALNGSFPEAINYIRFELDNLLPQENIRVWHPFPSIAGINLANASRTSVAQKLREAFLASLKPDIVHISSLFEGFVDDAVTSIGTQEPSLITSTTLYDLIPLLHREIYLKNPILQHWYEQKLDHLRRTQLYLAISDSSRNEAIEYLNASEEMVINVSTAADPHFQPIDVDAQTKKSVCQTYEIIKPFILYAGGIDPRKNISGLIQAFSLLPHELQKKYQLVIVCVIEDHQRVILKNECASKKLNSQDVIFTGHVPEKDLVLLYNSCDLFIFPSWHEGFGLPALEAMACGAATIAGNLSSLPEVIGRADALFDPHSPQSIANKITETLTDLSFQRSLKEHALEQAKKFSWEKSAKIAINAFEAIHENNRRPISTSTASSQDRLLQALRATKNVSENLLEIAQAISFNEPNSFQKRLFIDISELVERDAKTGIQRVVREILKELLTNPPKHFKVEPVYASLEHEYRYARKFTLDFLGHVDSLPQEDTLIEPKPGDIFIGLDLQPSVIPHHHAYFEKLYMIGVQVFFVLYDLIPILRPHYFHDSADTIFLRWLDTISTANGILCISRSVAGELKNLLIQQNKEYKRNFHIGYFHLGSNISIKPTSNINSNKDSATLENISSQTVIDHSLVGSGERGVGRRGNLETDLIPQTNILMVGTIEPRKGHKQALDAFEKLWGNDQAVNLIIAGKQGWMSEEIAKKIKQHPQINKKLFWFNSASDETLLRLYDLADGVLIASEAEGFGLPLVEAAQHNCPILARDIPVFREIAGEHARYFPDDTTRDTLATALDQWLTELANHTAPRSSDMPYLTWAESTQQLLSLVFDKHSPRWLDHFSPIDRSIVT